MIEQWLLCPCCGSKTRVKLRQDTHLEHFPLFCPKCRQECLINARDLQVTVVQRAESWRRAVGFAQAAEIGKRG